MKLKKSKICSEIDSQVKDIYDWLDSKIKGFNPQCSACGKCCNFKSFGHRLFVSSPEMLYFSRKNKIIPMTRENCPYQKDNKCTVYQSRFAGCRIFSCTGDAEPQNALSEEVLRKFKSICDKSALPYLYADLAKALNQAALPE